MKIIFQISIFIVLITLGASPVYSCECENRSARQKLRDTDTVFVGEVLDFKERVGVNTNKDFKFFPYQVTFKVEKQWKGKKQTEITGFADLKGGGMCQGFEMPVGKRFLIYAPRKSEQLLFYRSFCSPNEAAENANDEIKRLESFFYQTYSFLYPFPKF